MAQQPKLQPETRLWGYTENGQWTIAPAYLSAASFTEGCAVVQTTQGYSLINARGKQLNKSPYPYIGWSGDATESKLTNGVIGFRQANSWGLLNRKGRVQVPPIFRSLSEVGGYLVAETAGEHTGKKSTNSFGLINDKGEWLVQPIYRRFKVFQKNQLKAGRLVNSQLKWGLLSTEGQLIIPCQYDSLEDLGSGLVAAAIDTHTWELWSADGTKRSPQSLDTAPKRLGSYLMVKKDAALGLWNTSAEVVKPFQYKSINYKGIDQKDTGTDSLSLSAFPKIELIDSLGKVTATFYADSLKNIGKQTYLIYRNGKCNFWDAASQQLSPTDFSEAKPLVAELYKTADGTDWYMTDKRGQKMHSTPFKQLAATVSGLVRAAQSDNTVDLYNAKAENLTNGQYAFIGTYATPAFRVQGQNGQWGFLGALGQTLISPQYDEASDFFEGMAVVKQQDHFGIIDSFGQWVIRPVLDSAKILGKQTFYYRLNHRWGTGHINGLELFKTDLPAQQLANGYTLFGRTQYGLLTPEGTPLLPQSYDSIKAIDGQHVWCFQDGNRYFASSLSANQLPIPAYYAAYDSLLPPSEGLAAFQMGGRFGYASASGGIVVSNKFEAAQPFSEGLAAIQFRGRWGYIDRFGRFALQPQYQAAGNFSNGLAVVSTEKGRIVIDKSGQPILPTAYNTIYLNNHQHWIVEQEGKKGVYTFDGTAGIYPRYQAITDWGNGYIETQKAGGRGIDRLSGLTILFPQDRASIVPNFMDTTFQLVYPARTESLSISSR